MESIYNIRCCILCRWPLMFVRKSLSSTWFRSWVQCLVAVTELLEFFGRLQCEEDDFWRGQRDPSWSKCETVWAARSPPAWLQPLAPQRSQRALPLRRVRRVRVRQVWRMPPVLQPLCQGCPGWGSGLCWGLREVMGRCGDKEGEVRRGDYWRWKLR